MLFGIADAADHVLAYTQASDCDGSHPEAVTVPIQTGQTVILFVSGLEGAEELTGFTLRVTCQEE